MNHTFCVFVRKHTFCVFVLDEILNLIESVSEGFFLPTLVRKLFLCLLPAPVRPFTDVLWMHNLQRVFLI